MAVTIYVKQITFKGSTRGENIRQGRRRLDDTPVDLWIILEGEDQVLSGNDKHRWLKNLGAH